MKKIKIFLFSKLSIIFLLIMFFVINFVAFLVEYSLGKIDLSTEKWVRLASILSDFVIIGFGILSWFQIVFRRSSRIRSFLNFFSGKSLFWVRLFADILGAFSVIYTSYVIRLLIFWWVGKVTSENVFYNCILGLVGVFLFGFVNIFIRYTKKRIRRFNNSKEWSLALYVK